MDPEAACVPGRLLVGRTLLEVLLVLVLVLVLLVLVLLVLVLPSGWPIEHVGGEQA